MAVVGMLVAGFFFFPGVCVEEEYLRKGSMGAEMGKVGQWHPGAASRPG